MLTGVLPTCICRYAINDTSADWSTAETQVAKLARSGSGKSTLVSVKTAAAVAGQKRKAEKSAGADPKEKKARRSLKKGKQ